MNKSGLLVRLAIVIAFSSLAVGFVSAQIFYRLTYLNEVELAHQDIKQLYQTVSSTASIAAYLGDKELASEVVNGILTNDNVLDAGIELDNESLVSMTLSSDSEPLSFELFSPFEKEKELGRLYITPNMGFIEHRARQIGQNNSTALMVQAMVVTVIAIYLVYVLITKPMITAASRLHRVTPGSADRLAIPDFHKQSELGELIRDVNKLLEKSEHQISAERSLRNDIEVLEKRFRMLFENSASPIILMEPRGNILLFNKAFTNMLERIDIRFKKNFGPLLSDLFLAPEELQQAVKKAFANDEIATGEYQLAAQLTKQNSDSMWVQAVVTSILSEDMRQYYQVTLHDISKRKRELELLSKHAHFDQLTQLMNRHAAEQAVSKLIEESTPFALILMDLNGFKQINDIYGHESGDKILVHAASLLKASVRKEDMVSRWGGDEFVLILKNVSKQEVEAISQKFIQKVRQPFHLFEHNTHVTFGASMGVALFPEHDTQLSDLVRKADLAMYKAKGNKESNPENFLIFCSESKAN